MICYVAFLILNRCPLSGGANLNTKPRKAATFRGEHTGPRTPTQMQDTQAKSEVNETEEVNPTEGFVDAFRESVEAIEDADATEVAEDWHDELATAINRARERMTRESYRHDECPVLSKDYEDIDLEVTLFVPSENWRRWRSWVAKDVEAFAVLFEGESILAAFAINDETAARKFHDAEAWTD